MPKIMSSHGTKDGGIAFLICARSGDVVSHHLDSEWTEPIPTRFDVIEYCRWRGSNRLQVGDEIDILDIGYWNPDGTYIPNEREAHFQSAQAGNAMGNSVLPPYADRDAELTTRMYQRQALKELTNEIITWMEENCFHADLPGFYETLLALRDDTLPPESPSSPLKRRILDL